MSNLLEKKISLDNLRPEIFFNKLKNFLETLKVWVQKKNEKIFDYSPRLAVIASKSLGFLFLGRPFCLGGGTPVAPPTAWAVPLK